MIAVWLPMLITGAAVSQLAEFSHLHYARDWNWGYAYLFALGFVVIEYLFSVPAERGLQRAGFSPMLQYTIFNLTQILANGVMMVVIFKLKLNYWHLLAYAMLGVCVVFAALGDRKARADKERP